MVGTVRQNTVRFESSPRVKNYRGIAKWLRHEILVLIFGGSSPSTLVFYLGGGIGRRNIGKYEGIVIEIATPCVRFKSLPEISLF